MTFKWKRKVRFYIDFNFLFYGRRMVPLNFDLLCGEENNEYVNGSIWDQVTTTPDIDFFPVTDLYYQSQLRFCFFRSGEQTVSRVVPIPMFILPATGREVEMKVGGKS